MDRVQESQSRIVAAAFAAPQTWSKSYESLSSVCRAIADRWLQSRTEGVRATIDVFDKLATCRDPAQAAQLQQDWLKATIERLNAEMSDYQKQVMGLSRDSVAVLEAGLSSRGTPSGTRRAA